MTAIALTYSGCHVDLLSPDPDTIHIEDIARHLSNLCRFGGAVRQFYSVAEHSLRVAEIVPPQHRLTALLHDATEAYLQDIINPLKRKLPGYQVIEARMWQAVAERFDLPEQLPAEVKHADLVLLATEKRDLMPADSYPWAALVDIDPLPECIHPMAHGVVFEQFIAAFERYAQLEMEV